MLTFIQQNSLLLFVCSTGNHGDCDRALITRHAVRTHYKVL
jgi:hypothetical protein